MDTSSSSPLLVASLDLIESSTAALKVICYEQEFHYVGCGVLTAAVVKSSVSWDFMPCRPLKVKRYTGAIYHLRFQARDQHEACNNQVLCLPICLRRRLLKTGYKHMYSRRQKSSEIFTSDLQTPSHPQIGNKIIIYQKFILIKWCLK